MFTLRVGVGFEMDYGDACNFEIRIAVKTMKACMFDSFMRKQTFFFIPGKETAVLKFSRPDTSSTLPPNFRLRISSPRDFFNATWA